MGLADAPLIGAKVEGVIYAVESHGIRTGLVKEALGRLITANVPIIGCVLTKFDAKTAHYGYGYGYESGSRYGRKVEPAAACCRRQPPGIGAPRVHGAFALFSPEWSAGSAISPSYNIGSASCRERGCPFVWITV